MPPKAKPKTCIRVRVIEDEYNHVYSSRKSLINMDIHYPIDQLEGTNIRLVTFLII